MIIDYLDTLGAKEGTAELSDLKTSVAVKHHRRISFFLSSFLFFSPSLEDTKQLFKKLGMDLERRYIGSIGYILEWDAYLSKTL